jgi:phospholipase C
VRIPAALISPRIAAGTVFRAKRCTIDHRSVLKTIEVRWNLAPLTERDKAAPDLGDVLTLATTRSDDPLANVQVAVSNDTYPNQSQASVIDKIYVGKVAALPCAMNRGATTSMYRPI